MAAVVEAAANMVDAAMVAVFPISAIGLCMYPVVLLVWTALEGQAAAAKAARDAGVGPSAAVAGGNGAGDTNKLDVGAFAQRRGAGFKRQRLQRSAMVAVSVVAALIGTAAACFLAAGTSTPRAQQDMVSRPSTLAEQPLFGEDAKDTGAPSLEAPVLGVFLGSAFFAGVAAFSTALRYRDAKARARPTGRRSSFGNQEGSDVPIYDPPAPKGYSLWHDVSLHDKSWLDEKTGLYCYVNEIPMGSLQKFEVQPALEQNQITEDEKGSRRLRAFGQPVPFNYGCFPQTWRDPEEIDDIHGAGGDDDPLDVLDLSFCTASVGAVVRCRPLGAVCLIDEGQADWKVLAINVDSGGPLAGAESIEDVERIAPGRIQQVLQWMDDFKQHGKKDGEEVKLHFEIHDAKKAIEIIEGDHSSWYQLIADTGNDGSSHGHWVRPADKKEARTVVLGGWGNAAARRLVAWNAVERQPVGATRPVVVATRVSSRTTTRSPVPPSAQDSD